MELITNSEELSNIRNRMHKKRRTRVGNPDSCINPNQP